MTEPSDTSATGRLLAERYGVGSPRKRGLAIGALAVAVAVLLAWLAWAAWVQATRTVSGAIVSFTVASAHEVDATVEIHRPPDSAAHCTVRAQAVDHSTVGETVVSVPRGEDSTVQVDTVIKTDREATSADVSDCR